ncbi:pyrroline-5-carboxylate reductase 3 isoform X2 [Stegostoma tigrinum]|uniref:pyrroline-5-carboxylate reductase 3 isoform X2 n=1 Tax=Stegostoma tigrinum TaxID=3053191 RepID=UPI00202AF0F8|nr:pyrroline-5-carboxylate reductase 3 isoform X2 [Stegostoma tigrinum]
MAGELMVGFIGAGKMALGIASGLLLSGNVKPEKVIASAPSNNNLYKFKEAGMQTTHCNTSVVESCHVLFLSVKPSLLPGVLKEIAPFVTPAHLIVSVAAGVTIETLEKVYLFAAALAEGGVKMGMPYELSKKMVAQTLLGAAKMIMGSEDHLEKLKSDVCTPGGTTIHGLYELEKGNLRCTVMNAVEAATNRARELGKN